MFQTELVLFLQSLSTEYVTAFFKFFTEIGRSSYYVPLILVIIFGVKFRAGYIMLHLVIWNGIATEFLKNVFAPPRPANVDSAVQLFEKLRLHRCTYPIMFDFLVIEDLGKGKRVQFDL